MKQTNAVLLVLALGLAPLSASATPATSGDTTADMSAGDDGMDWGWLGLLGLAGLVGLRRKELAVVHTATATTAHRCPQVRRTPQRRRGP